MRAAETTHHGVVLSTEAIFKECPKLEKETIFSPPGIVLSTEAIFKECPRPDKESIFRPPGDGKGKNYQNSGVVS